MIFFFVSLLSYSQINNKIIIESKRVKKLLDICVEKADQINLGCATPLSINYKEKYVVRIKWEASCQDSFRIIIGRVWSKKDLLPIEKVWGYYTWKDRSVFILTDNVIISAGGKFEKDPSKLEKLVDSLVRYKFRRGVGEISPEVYYFSFNYSLLSLREGYINYRVYYPLVSLTKKDWPVEYQETDSSYLVDYTGELNMPPWLFCICDYNQVVKKTPEEIERMKHGTMQVNLRKRKQKVY